MKRYVVTVKVAMLRLYEVEAATPEQAMEIWTDGRFLRSAHADLHSEVLKAEEIGGAS